jgi:hypothetical protein
MTSGTKVVLPVWHNMDHDDVAEHSPLLAGRLAARTSGGIAHVASEILQVLTEAAANPPQIDRVPRTPEEETQLLLVRPEMWEYLLFASVMNREKAMLEPKYRDYELGFIRPSGPELDLQESFELVKTAFYGIRGLVSNVERVLGAAAQERAFGPEGTPGDPERIEHLGQRIVEIYEGLLDWAEKLRGAAVPDEFTRIVEVVVLMMDRPISTIRTFIDQTVKDMDRVPALLREPTEEPVTVEASLVIDIDEAVMDSFSDEMDRLEATVLGGFDGAQDDPSQ